MLLLLGETTDVPDRMTITSDRAVNEYDDQNHPEIVAHTRHAKEIWSFFVTAPVGPPAHMP